MPSLIVERQPDVPLAKAGRDVALLTQHLRQRPPVRSDQRRATGTGKDASPPRDPERHLSCHQAVSSWSAHGARTVCIGESHPLLCKTVKIRRRDLGVRVVAANITVAQIIRENEDDVRLVRNCCRSDRRSQECRDKEGDKLWLC